MRLQSTAKKGKAARQGIATEELEERKFIETCEASVRYALQRVQSGFLGEIRQHEGRVQAILMKHYQYLQSIQLDMERLVQEESVARDRAIGLERESTGVGSISRAGPPQARYVGNQ